MHTNFDTAVMADLAADRLKLQNKQPLAMVRETESGLKGIGSTGDLTEDDIGRSGHLCQKSI